MSEIIRDLDPGLNKSPARLGSIHIMGICGTAMAALAGMLKQQGYLITGSDSQVYPPMSDFLDGLGVKVFSGYSEANLAHSPDLVIVGNVITRINPEAQALAAAGIPYLSMPQALSRFFISPCRSLVVTGTHGKTTTSSMLASALFHAGADPGFMIGGILREFEANYRIGGGPYFISEGDEYDTAFFDKESKFLHYRPEVAVITSIEFDHADIFTDLEAIKRSFRKFVSLLPPHGLLIANTEDENVAEVVENAACPVQSYGLSPASDWQVVNITQAPGKTSFDLFYRRRLQGNYAIKAPGSYNCLNATAVAAVMHHLGLSSEMVAEGLFRFGGVKRRQEIRGIVNGITVIDDFAHHPTAVRETVNGLKQAYTSNRLVAVFEPRTNTSRRSIFQKDYINAFAAADLSVIREPSADKPLRDGDRFSAGQLAADLRGKGGKAEAFANTDQILSFLSKELEAGDVVAILSNGGFDNIHERLLKMLEAATH